MIIGVTGGIGSGKSTVIKMFAKFENIAIYIADSQAKKLMNSSEEIKTKLIAEFGENTYKNNELNTAFLANIVFKNKEKLAVLNAIVHPVVHKHFQNFILENAQKSYILYENAILFENNSNNFCDKIITVTAPENIRIERVLKRDNTTITAVKNRIKNQWSETKKILQSNYVIQNIIRENTQHEVTRIHNILTNTNR
ncbi:dephospho-CoA kinase [Tenacibaculum piscium]|uniref:dephospho-CoA kinase n=1 Tax=Tenacibaculum piscium TaxID=1458515 RepID=UPI00187B7901|nr:dephospho-CoA kinase [Tenacibaculum piscium]MBE7670619.1 dephospho-CoA kinase [Tenacibaculum piscium]MBE7685306.1 dephospho-CoA kinase [Tenacibaculum piscium]MBE7690582.1 dephospho-CoA kinase [Tenacibaculum piscium]MCG8182499.1 dephospho-CoA kinase [Tenacibaculum piscium]MCG8203891.1 dephospho-CoA kinase [Tenacibaculum piscium]